MQTGIKVVIRLNPCNLILQTVDMIRKKYIFNKTIPKKYMIVYLFHK